MGNQSGGSLRKLFGDGRVMGAVENQCGNAKAGQHCRKGSEEFGRITERSTNIKRQEPSKPEKGTAKVSNSLDRLGPPRFRGA